MGIEQTLGHIPALRRYARLLTGDPARADDLVQDTLERACVKWSLWQPGSALRSWLLSMMHNLHANQRRDWRHDDGHAALEDVPEPAHEPMANAAERMDLQRALAALPPPMREVLLLVTVEEYTYSEAAVILDVPVGGWRQLSWPVDDKYLGRLRATSGLVREAGLPWVLRGQSEDLRDARQEDFGPPSAQVQEPSQHAQPGRIGGQGRHQ